MRARSSAGLLTRAGPALAIAPALAVGPALVIWLACGVCLLLGVSATSGLWAHPASGMIAGNVPDAIHYSWWLGHTPTAIGRGHNPLTTLDLNWPQGVSAMNGTTLLLPSLLLAPITALAGGLAGLNLLNVLAVPACAAAGYWAARRLPLLGTDPAGGERRIGRSAALAAGTAFAISPAIVNSLVGHVTMAFAPGLPILLALGIALWHGQRPVRSGLLLGVAATVQLFTAEELLFQAGMGSLFVLLVAALSRPRAVPAAARRLGVGLAAAFAVFLPVAGYPLYLQFRGPLRQHGSPFLPGYFGADLTSFTTTNGQVLLHTRAGALAAVRFPGGVEEHLSYLGWPLLITCLAGAVLGWRRLPVRCAALGLLIAMAFSLGGRLWYAGTWTEHHGPYALLERLPVTEASLATRFGLLAALFAAALLGIGVHALSGLPSAGPRPPLDPAHPIHPVDPVDPVDLGRPAEAGRGAAWLRPLAASGLVLACLLPLVPAPLRVVPAPAVPAYFTSAALDLPRNCAVLVLPYPIATGPTAMLWQAAADYRFRMPGGYFLGPGSDGHAYVDGAAPVATARLLIDVAASGRAPTLTAAQRSRAAADFAVWGLTRVVLGPSPAGDALRATVSDLLGSTPERIEGVDVWSPRSSG